MGVWQRQAGAGREQGLEQYRTYGRFYERYWSRLFSLTESDMARFAELMREQRAALDLTTLAKDIIRTRLRHGPELNSGPAPNGSMPAQVVRLWDAAAMWRVGDRAIMAMPATVVGRHYTPSVGEIRQVGDDHVIIQIDGIPTPQVYALGIAGRAYERYASPDMAADQPLLTREILSLADKEDEVSQVDYVLWRFGASIVGHLLHALQAASEFLELEGLWYRGDLAHPLREAQVVSVARAMFAGSARPLTVQEVLAMLSAGHGNGVAERFGSMLSLQERPDLFTNVGTGSYPRWTLAGPPPMRLVAANAVYDPETYVVLCTSGETLSLQAAQRLWDAGLLRAALGDLEAVEAGQDARPVHPTAVRRDRTGQGAGTTPVAPADPQLSEDSAPSQRWQAHREPPPVVGGRSRRPAWWQRWLSFGSRD